MRQSTLADAFLAMTMTPALADEDEALARALLKGLEIGIKSSQAAKDCANAVLITIMNRKPEIEVLAPWLGVDDCFRQACDEARDAESWQHDFRTDEQLSADGCFTRAKSLELACGSYPKYCPEPVPENIADTASEGVMSCLKNSPRAKLLHEHLYDIFQDEELKKRLDALEPDVNEAIQSQLGIVDA